MDKDYFDLNNKVALVLGGAGGIGQAIVTGLANYGATVVVADINFDQAVSVSNRVQKAGKRSIALEADITKARSIEEMIAHTLSEMEGLDIFINTVGWNVFQPSLEIEENDWQKVIHINLTGAFMASRAVAKGMAERDGGCIVNFASVTSLRGSPGQAAYAAAKAGLVNLTKSLALEWITYRVRVNAISPVMTETPINTDWLNEDPERKPKIASRIPVGRLGDPTDFIGPVVFLSSEASRFMIGQTLYVDGGASITHPLID